MQDGTMAKAANSKSLETRDIMVCALNAFRSVHSGQYAQRGLGAKINDEILPNVAPDSEEDKVPYDEEQRRILMLKYGVKQARDVKIYRFSSKGIDETIASVDAQRWCIWPVVARDKEQCDCIGPAPKLHRIRNKPLTYMVIEQAIKKIWTALFSIALADENKVHTVFLYHIDVESEVIAGIKNECYIGIEIVLFWLR